MNSIAIGIPGCYSPSRFLCKRRYAALLALVILRSALWQNNTFRAWRRLRDGLDALTLYPLVQRTIPGVARPPTRTSTPPPRISCKVSQSQKSCPPLQKRRAPFWGSAFFVVGNLQPANDSYPVNLPVDVDLSRFRCTLLIPT